MKRNISGLKANDPFFDRMLDERIATLRAFLQMTTQKYDVPGISPNSDTEFRKRVENSDTSSNVIPMSKRARTAR